MPEGGGAEPRKTAADWDAWTISGWPPHHGGLSGPAQEGTAVSDGQPTKLKHVISEQLLIMLSLMLFLCCVARERYSNPCNHTSHICSYCFLYLDETLSLHRWLTKTFIYSQMLVFLRPWFYLVLPRVISVLNAPSRCKQGPFCRACLLTLFSIGSTFICSFYF